MGAAIAALGGISERQQKTFVTARQILQAKIAARWKVQRVLRQVIGFGFGVGRCFHQAFRAQQLKHARYVRFGGCRCRARHLRCCVFSEREIQKPVRVIKRRPQHLPAGDVLEGSRHAPLDAHGLGVHRHGGTKSRQRGARRTDEKDRLDQIAARLFDGQGRPLPVIERALVHHPVDCQGQLLCDLLQREGRHLAVAAALLRQQPMRGIDGFLAAFHRHIHQASPGKVMRVERGRPITWPAVTNRTSNPRGNRWWFRHRSCQSPAVAPATEHMCAALRPGPDSSTSNPESNLSHWITSVVERSGYSCDPNANPSRPAQASSIVIKANRDDARSGTSGAPVSKRRNLCTSFVSSDGESQMGD